MSRKNKISTKLGDLAKNVRAAEGQALRMAVGELIPTFGTKRSAVRKKLRSAKLGVFPQPMPTDGKVSVIVYALENRLGTVLDACRRVDDKTIGRLLDVLDRMPSPSIPAAWTPTPTTNSEKISICRWTPAGAAPWTERVTSFSATPDAVSIDLKGADAERGNYNWTLSLQRSGDSWEGRKQGADWSVQVRDVSVQPGPDELYVEGEFEMLDRGRIYAGTFEVTVTP